MSFATIRIAQSRIYLISPRQAVGTSGAFYAIAIIILLVRTRYGHHCEFRSSVDGLDPLRIWTSSSEGDIDWAEIEGGNVHFSG